MDVLIPGLKDRLWHHMRADLARYLPQGMPADLLMCPTCARWLPYEKFSIEHIIPKQALADDPPEIRAKLHVNQRSPLILLCSTPLKIRVAGENLPREAYGGGCNSWKGSVYDSFTRRMFNRRVFTDTRRGISTRNTIGCMSIAFLAMVARYGYQIALTPSGSLLRRQFFSPNRHLKDMPTRCQMVLMGDQPIPADDTIPYWRADLTFNFDQPNVCVVAVRNVSMMLPCSRDPRLPIAASLPFQPSKYILRPDFRTMFV